VSIISKSIRQKIKENRFDNQQIKRKAWSAYDDQNLEKMFRDGVGLSEISVKLHRTENAVFQRAKKLNLYPPKMSSKNGSPEQRKQQAKFTKEEENNYENILRCT